MISDPPFGHRDALTRSEPRLSFPGLNQLTGVPIPRDGEPRPRDAVVRGGSTLRVLDAWDGFGVAATVAVMSLLAACGAVRANTGYTWLPEALFVLGAGALLSVVAASLALARRRSLGVRGTSMLLARVWLDPPRDWFLFGLGFLVALPALALHTEVLLGDSDSARVVSSTLYVQRNGLGYLTDTQDNLLPYVTMGPVLALGGIPAAKLLSIVSVQMLAGSVSFLAWKLARSGVAALAAVIALLGFPLIWERATLLPLYPLMLAFGFLGLYFAQRATVLRGKDRTLAALLAGGSFVLSFESNRMGQFFLAFALFLFLTDHWKPVAQGLARVFLYVVVLSIPRILINLWEGGLNNFLSNRDDYWTNKGYLLLLQEDFFHLPIKVDLPTYLAQLAKHSFSLFAWSGLIVLGLGLISLGLARGRGRRFALACLFVFVAAILYRRIPYFPRYFSPLMVAGAIGAGTTIDFLLRRSAPLRSAALIALVVLIVGAGFTYVGALGKAKREQAAILAGPLRTIAGEINDGKGVIGARSGWLLFSSPRIKTYGGQFLTEREFVTYLTWPSDQEVIDVLRAHDIGWVLIYGRRRFEIGYHNAWLRPAYGKTVHDVRRVAASPLFCNVRQIGRNILYKLGPCPS
jgi:hypothetical protein